MDDDQIDFNNINEQDEEINQLSSFTFDKNYGIFFILTSKLKMGFDSNFIKIIYKKKIKNFMIYIINSYNQIDFKIKCIKKGFINKVFYSIDSYEFNPKEKKIDFIINPKFENQALQNFNITQYDEIKLLFNGINEIKDDDNKQLKDKLIINLLRYYVDKLDNKRLDLLEYFFLLSIYSSIENYDKQPKFKNLIQNFNPEYIIIENNKNKLNEIKIKSDIFCNKNKEEFKNLIEIELYYYFLKENYKKFFGLINKNLNCLNFVKNTFKKNKEIQKILNDENFYKNIKIENEYKDNLNDNLIIITNKSELENIILFISFEKIINLINDNLETIKNFLNGNKININNYFIINYNSNDVSNILNIKDLIIIDENEMFKKYLEHYKYDLDSIKIIIEFIDKFNNANKDDLLNYFFNNSINIIKKNKYNKIENPSHYWNNLNIFKFILFDYELNKNKNTKKILNLFKNINIFEATERTNEFYDYFKGIKLKEIFNENLDKFIEINFNNVNNFNELNNCYELFNKNKELIDLFNECLLNLLENKFNYYELNDIKKIMIQIMNDNKSFKKEFFDKIIENGELNKILDFFILFLNEKNNFAFKNDYINQIIEYLKQNIINFDKDNINKLEKKIEKNIYFEIFENFVIDENDFYDNNSQKLKLFELVIKTKDYFNKYDYSNYIKSTNKILSEIKDNLINKKISYSNGKKISNIENNVKKFFDDLNFEEIKNEIYNILSEIDGIKCEIKILFKLLGYFKSESEEFKCLKQMNENLEQLNLDAFKKNYINIKIFINSDDYKKIKIMLKVKFLIIF